MSRSALVTQNWPRGIAITESPFDRKRRSIRSPHPRLGQKFAKGGRSRDWRRQAASDKRETFVGMRRIAKAP